MEETQFETAKGVHPLALRTLAKLEDYLLNADELLTSAQVKVATNLHAHQLMLLTLTPTINCITEHDLISEVENKYFLFGTFYGPVRPTTKYYYHTENEDRLKYKWAKDNLKRITIH